MVDNTTEVPHALLQFQIPPLPIALLLPPIGEEVGVPTDNTSFDRDMYSYIKDWIDSITVEGEAGLHHRNDGLLSILFSLAELTSSSRISHEMSTQRKLRSDRTDRYNGIPLVLVEEEDHGSVLQCINDLTRNFQWIPHFQQLPFIFGIAITRVEISIGKLVRDGSYRQFFRIGLHNQYQKLQAVAMVIKMARVLKYFKLNFMGAISAEIPIFGDWIDRNAKRLRIGFKFVENKFSLPEYAHRYEFLKTMYQRTDTIPHKEKLFSSPTDDTQAFVDKQRVIRLHPIGIRKLPDNVHDGKECLRSIVDCMSQVHAAGYVHCDIRWPNILYANGDWILIDFTLAQALDDPISLAEISGLVREEYMFRGTGPWTTRHDYYQIGKLIENSAFLNGKRRFRKLKRLLLAKDSVEPAVILEAIDNIQE